MTTKFFMYRNRDNGSEMISLDNAVQMIRDLGSATKAGLETIDKPMDASDLWAGLGAYTMLKLAGESPLLDKAYDVTVSYIISASNKRAQEMLAERGLGA